MGLPFLEPKKITSIIIARRGKNPDLEAAPEVEAPGSEMNPALKMAAEDILSAIDARSPMDLAKAIKSAYEACEGEPHEEAGEPEMDKGA